MTLVGPAVPVPRPVHQRRQPPHRSSASARCWCSSAWPCWVRPSPARLSRVIGAPIARVGASPVTWRARTPCATRSAPSTTASALMIGVGPGGLLRDRRAVGQGLDQPGHRQDHRRRLRDRLDGFAGPGGLDPELTRDVGALPQVDTAAGLRVGLAEVDHSGHVPGRHRPPGAPRDRPVRRASPGRSTQLGTDGVVIPKHAGEGQGTDVLGSTIPATFTADRDADADTSRPSTTAPFPVRLRYIVSQRDVRRQLSR